MTDLLTHEEYRAIAAALDLPQNAWIDGSYRPALSGKILTARQQGSFKSWQDLVERVSGMGPGNAARLSQNGLTVAGAAYAPVAAAAKPAREAARQVCKQRYLQFGCEGQGSKIKGNDLKTVAAQYARGELAQVVQ